MLQKFGEQTYCAVNVLFWIEKVYLICDHSSAKGFIIAPFDRRPATSSAANDSSKIRYLLLEGNTTARLPVRLGEVLLDKLLDRLCCCN